MRTAFLLYHNRDNDNITLPFDIDKINFYVLLAIGLDADTSMPKVLNSIKKMVGHTDITQDKVILSKSNLVKLKLLTENTKFKSGYELTPDGIAALIIRAHNFKISMSEINGFAQSGTEESMFIYKMISERVIASYNLADSVKGLTKYLSSNIFWTLPISNYGKSFYSDSFPIAIIAEMNQNQFTILEQVNKMDMIEDLGYTNLRYEYRHDMALYSDSADFSSLLLKPIGMDYLNTRKALVKSMPGSFGILHLIDLLILKMIDPHKFESEQKTFLRRYKKREFNIDSFVNLVIGLMTEFNPKDTLNYLNNNLEFIRRFNDIKGLKYLNLLLLTLLVLSCRNEPKFVSISRQLTELATIRVILAQPPTTPFMIFFHRVISELLKIKSSLPPLFETVPESEKLIHHLHRLKSMHKGQGAVERVSWVVDTSLYLSAKVQKQTKKGWSTGRAVTFTTLYKGMLENRFDYDEADIALGAYLSGAFLQMRDIRLNKAMLNLLAKSNKVFNEDNEPVIFEPQKQLLLLKPNQNHLEVSIFPEVFGRMENLNDVVVEDINGGYYRFNPSDEVTQSMVKAIGEASKIDKEHKDAILDLIKDHVDYFDETTSTGSITLQKWDETPQLWLSIDNSELKIDIEHQTTDGRLSVPTGDFDEWVEVAPSEWARRDLAKELAQLKTLCDAIGVESYKGQYPNDLQFDFSQASQVIETISNLDGVKLHWRKGSRRVQVVSAKDFNLSINEKGGWFAVKGGIQLDGAEFIQLKRLLSAKRSGYIELEQENVQLILSKALQEQINLLDSVLNEKQEVEATLAYPLQKLIETMQVESDKGWQKLEKQWRKPVKVNKNLLAPLRDYQKDSVNWAIHLLTNGFGACLADDMGLGKTIQSLKVIEHFANQGPSLVIAPKSVLHNWQVEAQKFAPTLNAVVLDSAEDKSMIISELKERDLLIVGYSQAPLFETELNAIEWQTVILDEAQNIKNPIAKRTQALMTLKAKGKMTLSGTPIENHLIELWSQFAFLNPGLLGSLAQFKDKYGQAAKDERDMARLRALVSPFIMRRLKKDVLKELPEKIEINHTITLSEQEMAAYEAVRQTALVNAKTNPIELLAALTRLRQICCDSYLVFKEKTEISSKLEEAINLIREGLESGHRILVFSQFVTLLERLGHFMKEDKIKFSYLDGKTSLKKRETEIEQFKSGKNPVFLISLKAGGTGLNLTEADMVIHLDPWWNPAVEDQASDRAHRMGQVQPVTIYRLVTENTIEEKIIALHQEKRDLAEKVLSGQDGAKKLDPALLLSLLGD